ncbi:branched-chain amino acid ABC transporter permease [Azospirillum rugosum]|uniref:Branched-chain amino acid transport system permease protein n=1 Tax=Azospirillum rugosum TaxID=416170 RepID=A0ABS4SJK8_9PROT|nr:branched-chain amino acid ABC transporter permease [Azospirillum rugosum]MBP2292758.1 branched-chain amino acid transport system permease protein [Azospirillum rugosum]MDQ0527017.1 branched-chain amino acid transport system permease protein [Azospirillum rugosum]
MNLQIVMLLGQDGVTNGAIYALLALSILLVFTVTRILLIPQGEFVSFAALTMAAMQSGTPVRMGWLLVALALAAVALDLYDAARGKGRWRPRGAALAMLAYAAAVTALTGLVPLDKAGVAVQALLTVALVVPLGPLLYRVFYQPIAAAHSLVLLIVSIAVHVVLVGAGLLMFGPEGARTEPFSEEGLSIGMVTLNSQTLWVVAVSLLLIVLLYAFFERTLYGKALRAAAVNRLGAELVGISPEIAGKASFGLAALIGGLSGILIAPITTIYFDSGFIISLKGFVGAIIGGMASYPVAALGALFIGQAESFSTFWASSYKEVIVFTLILPVLLWRSLSHKGAEDEE